MPRYRPMVTQVDAALVVAEDFARACKLAGDMSNSYRWRSVAKEFRAMTNAGVVTLDRFVDHASERPPFELKHSGVLLPLS